MEDKNVKWPRTEQGDVLCYDENGALRGAMPFPAPDRYYDVKGTEYKQCSHCGRYLPVTNFPKVWGGRKGQYLGAYCSDCRQLAYEGKIKLRGVRKAKRVGALPQLGEKVDDGESDVVKFKRPKVKTIMEKEEQVKVPTPKDEGLTEEQKLRMLNDVKNNDLGKLIMGMSKVDVDKIILGDTEIKRQKAATLRLFNDQELIDELKQRGYTGTLSVARTIKL